MSNEPKDILATVKEIAKGRFFDPLYKRRGLYFGSIMKKCLATYKSTCALVEEGMIEKIHDSLYPPVSATTNRGEAPMGSESGLYRTGPEYQKQLEKLRSKSPETALNETIEKLAILGYLVGRDMREFIERGQSVLDSMYEGHFARKRIPPEEIRLRFAETNKRYVGTLRALMMATSQRVLTIPGQGRMRILPYKEAVVQAVHGKTEQKFEVDAVRKQMKIDALGSALLGQIEANIQRREKEGTPQKKTREMMRKFLEGDVTAENEKLFQRLIAEANTQLQLLQLPAEYKEHTATMAETIRQTVKSETGLDPDLVLRKAVVAQENSVENSMASGTALPRLPDLKEFAESLRAAAAKRKQTAPARKEISILSTEQRNETAVAVQEESPKSLMEAKKAGFGRTDSTALSIQGKKRVVYPEMSREETAKLKSELAESLKTVKDLPIMSDFDPNDTNKQMQAKNNKVVKLGEQDYHHCDLLTEALETGQPMDYDPIYLNALKGSKKFQKLRERNTGRPIPKEIWDMPRGILAGVKESPFVRGLREEEDEAETLLPAGKKGEETKQLEGAGMFDLQSRRRKVKTGSKPRLRLPEIRKENKEQ